MKLTLNNYTAHKYRGWVQVVCPTLALPPTDHKAWISPDGDIVVPGRPWGHKCRLLHVWTVLAPHQGKIIDDWSPHNWLPDPLPPGDPIKTFGIPKWLGYDMAMIGTLQVDGPQIRTLWRARHLDHVVELWVSYYIGQPWAEAEFFFAASNIEGPVEKSTTAHKRLTFDPAVVRFRSTGTGYLPVMEPGRDQGIPGQPLALYWLNHPLELDDATSMMCFDEMPVQAHVEEMAESFGPVGVDPPVKNALGFSAQHVFGALGGLSSWQAGPLAVAANSGDSGGQEDQGYAFTEPFQPGGNGAQWVRYLVACGMARRGCHYYEKDGSPLRLDLHPNLVLYSGGPIFWSKDQLGRTQGMQIDLHGWSTGADREHMLWQTLSGSALLSGSPMLQRLLEFRAKQILFGETVDPNLATSGPGAPRGVGWTLLAMAWLYEALADRVLADRLRDRAEARVKQILHPALVQALSGRQVKAWKVTQQSGQDIWQTDGWHWVPWEHGIAALGAACALASFGWKELREVAETACETTLLYGYSRDPLGKWREWDKVAWISDGSRLAPELYGEPGWTQRSGWFSEWTGAAAAAALRIGHPNAEVMTRAQEIDAQVWGDRKSKWRVPCPPAVS